MSTRVLDRWGKPLPTTEVRRRMGFMGGDLLPVDHDTATDVKAPERPDHYEEVSPWPPEVFSRVPSRPQSSR